MVYHVCLKTHKHKKQGEILKKSIILHIEREVKETNACAQQGFTQAEVYVRRNTCEPPLA